MTFEDACRVVKVSAEELRTLGLEGACALLTQRATAAGWTPMELSEEAARRLRVQLAKLRKKKCPKECVCECHEEWGGGAHDHWGRPCPGKQPSV